MGDIPARVRVIEMGPREGFQMEPAINATERKVALIEALADSGLGTVECALFVNPKVVPVMADAEQTVAGNTGMTQDKEADEQHRMLGTYKECGVPDMTWPDSKKIIDETFAGGAEAGKRKMICDNAAKLYF